MTNSEKMTTQHRYQGYPYSVPRVTDVSDSRVTPISPVTPTTPTTPNSSGRAPARYQGYPYTNPHVHDAPTIDAATANRWAHLPRKPLETRNNVVYVDMPEEGGSQVTRSVAGATQTSGPTDKKTDIDDNPVIYIDFPESGRSDVAEPAEREAEPAYVQETIFYNPFDNRRIDQEKDADTRSSDSDSVGSGTPRRVRPAPGRPTPPNTLNLTSPGSSSGYGSSYTTPGLPPSMSKEAYVYRQQTPEDFPISPIPISEFPQPPPAYTEIESPRVDSAVPVHSPVPTVPVPVPVPAPVEEPPRTVVITPGSAENRQRTDEPSPIGLPNPYRKVVYCHHCGLRVHTLVIRQTGTATHVVALTALCIGLFPVTILVYCTDTCKNKNHYCPNCNKMIGYEVPILCQNMTFTK